MTSLIVIGLLVFGWDLAWYLAGVRPFFPWQLKKFLRQQKVPTALIDVRTPGEYKWFHIEGSINMPELLSNQRPLKDVNREQPVIVICMTGHRSPVVAYRLKKLGYRQVYNLTWGMLAWKLFGGKTR